MSLLIIWSTRARAMMPLLASVLIVLTGTAMLTTIVSLHLSRPGIGTHSVQMVLTAYPVGFLVGCLAVRPIVRRQGHETTYLLVAGTVGLAACGLAATSDLVAWSGLRFIGGVAIAAMFIVCESWVNLYADHASRGSLFSLYMMTTVISGLTGQLMLALIGPESPYALGAAAAIILAGVGFMAMNRPWPALTGEAAFTPHPTAGISSKTPRYTLWTLALIAPVTVVAVFQSGVTNLNIYVMTPIYGSQIGVSPQTVVALVTAISIGGMVAQTPVGWLSDRFDRRLILLGQGIAALLLCGAIAWLGNGSHVLLFLLFAAYGAVALTVYPVALGFANARIHSRYVVQTSGALLLLYSVGNVLTPGIAAGLMQRFAPSALFAMLGIGAALVALTAIYTLLRGSSPTAQALAAVHGRTDE